MASPMHVRRSSLSLHNCSFGSNGGNNRSRNGRSNSNSSCRTTSALAAATCSIVDFWNRMSQNMAYIDGSTRSSSMVDGSNRLSLTTCEDHVDNRPRCQYRSGMDLSAVSSVVRVTQQLSSASSVHGEDEDESTDSASIDSPRKRHSSNGRRPTFQCHSAMLKNKSSFASDKDQQEVWHHVFAKSTLDQVDVNYADVAQDDDWELKAYCTGRLPLSATSTSILFEMTTSGGRTRINRHLSTPADMCYLHTRKPSSWDESVALQRRRSVLLATVHCTGANSRTAKCLNGGTTAFLMVPTSPEMALLDKKDIRYYFQHPYPRLFISYFVIFCNFLLFAEDPISHSHTESDIAVVGNVFSFVLTKYPPEWRWSLIKVLMWLLAMICGMVLGKTVIHGILFSQVLRLKMFRDDQGSWMTMFLTVIVSLYVFSYAYNLLIFVWYKDASYQINSHMGVTNASLMKAAACSTWLGDLITALMVTDMMLQDNLYPTWTPWFRMLWRSSNIPRILIFWVGSVLATSIVVTLIVSDWISWDNLNKDFLSTSELSRAFLASFILVMDLLIVMQDWDFPHFTTTLHVNLPGFNVATLKWKYAEVDITGKWFNYGIIVMVMLLDLNMWKNQIFYDPAEFGQYTGPDDKIHTVNDWEILKTGNASFWTWESRSHINPVTGQPYYLEDMEMNSRYMGFPLSAKWAAFIPSGIILLLFILLVSLYGRFPLIQTQNVKISAADRTRMHIEKTEAEECL